MSGSGSGGTNTTADYVYTAEKGLTEAFENVNTDVVDAMKKAEAVDTTPVAASGEGGQTAFLGASVNIRQILIKVWKTAARIQSVLFL